MPESDISSTKKCILFWSCLLWVLFDELCWWTTGTWRIRVCQTCLNGIHQEACEPGANYWDKCLSSAESHWALCLMEKPRDLITVRCTLCYIFWSKLLCRLLLRCKPCHLSNETNGWNYEIKSVFLIHTPNTMTICICVPAFITPSECGIKLTWLIINITWMCLMYSENTKEKSYM